MPAAAKNQVHHLSNRYIINHDIMHCTADGVQGNTLYSGRALGISEPWDLIQLNPELKCFWPTITAHYDRVGLSHTKEVIWDLDLHELGRHVGHLPSVFFFGPDECRYWGDNRWLAAVEFINSKNSFMELASQLGVDVPRTHCFDMAGEIVVETLDDELIYPCYIKAAVSVAGVGIYRCENREELLTAINSFHRHIPVQIQEEVRAESFLNLQYQVENGVLTRLAASEQILDGFAHQGNRVPASHEPWAAVEPMAEWLMEQGIQGIFAFDVAVMQTSKGLRFPAIECNPRFNGASYPTLIANKLGVREWSAVTLETSHRELAEIDLTGLEFSSELGAGVVLVNWGTVKVGKLVVLLAGSRERQQQLLDELAKRL